MKLPSWFILCAILTPILGAIALTQPRMQNREHREHYVMGIVLLTSIFVIMLIIKAPPELFKLFRLTEHLTIAFRVDGLSRLFACIVAILWPVTTLYAFDYMHHEGGEQRFFGFYLLAYGIVLGVAFAGSMVTMYLFFELLTLSTLPLVMHQMDAKARYAGLRYLIYSMTGAALGFISVIFLSVYGSNDFFTFGGMLNPLHIKGNEVVLQAVFTLGFFGFGVKAALFPGYQWLPLASIAPTPVTALLHAVAVVKAGVFACIRLVYYGYGPELLKGSFAQTLTMLAAVFTIAFGAIMAYRTDHFKRRLAYSTISNLSYILFSVTIMTEQSLHAASLHMLYHAFAKITLFFGAGAIIAKSGKEYVSQLSGLATKMPVTFATYALSSLTIMGIPPLPGFWSKWAIGSAALAIGSRLSYWGIAALMLSTLLTALYQLDILSRAYYPIEESSPDTTIPSASKRARKFNRAQQRQGFEISTRTLESKNMNLTLLILSAAILLLGIFDGYVEQWVHLLF